MPRAALVKELPIESYPAPLLSTGEATPGVLRCVQIWAFQYERDMEMLEGVLQRTTEVINDLEPLSCEKS